MNTPVVHIVDDDAAVRDSIGLLCETAGLRAQGHDSAEAFLSAFVPDQPGCIVLDIRMGRMSGPELQAELVRRGNHLPIIFLTAHGDIPTTVRAMKAGAVDFLTKPVDGGALLERILLSLHQDTTLLDRQENRASQRQRLAALTPRERQTMMLALAGQSNKAIARQMGISHRTVEIHRSHILQKTGATNMLELARLAAECGLTSDAAEPGTP